MSKRKQIAQTTRGDDQTEQSDDEMTEQQSQSDDYMTGTNDTAEETVATDISDHEQEQTILLRPREPLIRPSTSSAKGTRELAPKGLRRSTRLRKKRQANETNNQDQIPEATAESKAKGDSTGMYGMLKGVIQEMTTQIISAIQAAFRGNGAVDKQDNPNKTTVKTKTRKTARPFSSLPSDSKSSDSESTEESNDESDDGSIMSSQVAESKSKWKTYGHSVKLPSFTGKEKWEVWYNRFESVAELKGWDTKDKLQELLPRLQDEAGDFAFDELPSKTLKSYRKLTRELENRFGIIEHARTYKLQFSRRKQHATETPAKFASELKRLYNKAYRNRDKKTRQEDLIQRFLLGLQDYKARIHVELNRDPKTIEEAVEEVIMYNETMKNPNQNDDLGYKKSVRQVRNTNQKGLNTHKNKYQDSGKPGPKNPTVNENPSMQTEMSDKRTYTKQELKEIFDEMFKDKRNELQENNMAKTNQTLVNRNSSGTFKSPIICFSCGQPGHIARNCISKPYVPKKMDSTRFEHNSSKGTGTGSSQSSPQPGFALN